MSLLTKASLVLTPNAIKSNKVYSIIPSNGNGDLTFTRDTVATQINSFGNVENVLTTIPRLNYDSVGGCPSLLLEPQRTNLMTYSKDFSNTNWSKNGTVVLSTNNLAPDGTLSATRLTADVINPTLQQTITGTIGLAYTTSFWARRVSGTSQIYLRCGDALPISNIAVTSTWQLFSYSGTSSTTTIRCGIGISGGILNTDIIEIWGAQLELGSYPTSYIPTTTSAVTRNADVCSKSGISDLIGQTEGVMFIESAALFNDLTSRYISISDGTSNNRILLFYNNTSNVITLASVSNGTVVISGISYTISDETQFAKIAVRYSNTLGYSLWVNGVNRASSALTTLPLIMSRFGFDSSSGGATLYAKVKQIQLYKTYLTDTEMTQLTTL